MRADVVRRMGWDARPARDLSALQLFSMPEAHAMKSRKFSLDLLLKAAFHATNLLLPVNCSFTGKATHHCPAFAMMSIPWNLLSQKRSVPARSSNSIQ